MSSDDDKRSGPTTIAMSAGAVLRLVANDNVPLPAAIADMTDEQWAEHDARVAAARARDEALVEADRRRAMSDAFCRAGFPQRALDSARNAQNTNAVTRVRGWDPARESVLVLSGSPGCGKTVAAAWWALRQPNAPTFVRATTFAASSRYDRETRATWFGASALVLDDLGTEYLDAKGSFLVDLDELMDVFYGDRKPLLITTNCALSTFRDRYGARVVDRLRECGAFCSLADPSLRSKP